MPLKSGKSEETFKENIKELLTANKSKSTKEKRPIKQILAIAYNEKRKSK